MQITFPDGSVREYENGINGLDIAASLSQGLRKSLICCEIDGERASITFTSVLNANAYGAVGTYRMKGTHLYVLNDGAWTAVNR